MARFAHLGSDVQMMLSVFSRWSAPLNRDIPPDFSVKSAHIYADSVRCCAGSEGPGIVQSVSSYSYLLDIGFLGICLNLGPKISHSILGIIENH
jgi:hypothetical protein